MSMRDMIREAIGGKSPKNRFDYKTQPNLYELENFLNKSGYIYVDLDTEEGKPVLYIKPAKEDDYLHPKIYYIADDNEYVVDSGEFGYLNVSDLAEVMKGYNNAILVIKHISDLDLDKLSEEL